VAGSDAEDAGVRPTGVQAPPECRFATLTKGLSKVASGGRVVAMSAALPVSFMTETFPLRIPAHTTLTTADGPPVPADFVISGTGSVSSSGTRSALAVLGDGATVRGFSIFGTGCGIALISGEPGAAIALDTLTLKSTGLCRSGVDVSSTATLVNVDIDGASAGLRIEPGARATVQGGAITFSAVGQSEESGVVVYGSLSATNLSVQIQSDGLQMYDGSEVMLTNCKFLNNRGSGLTVFGGALTANGGGSVGNFLRGVLLIKGSVSLSSFDLSSNRIAGLLVDTAGQSTSADLSRVTVTGNGGYGIQGGPLSSLSVRNSTISNNASGGITTARVGTLTLEGNDIFGNGMVVAWGGVFVGGPIDQASFLGNKIHSNHGPQLRFDVPPTTGTWNLAPASATCDASANAIYCYDAGSVGISAPAGVAVNAANVHWQNATPAKGTDFSGPVSALRPCAAMPTCP
jgi:hypothetical protein